MRLDRPSPILETLAELYAASTVGRTGAASRHYGVPYPQLLEKASCTSGERLTLADDDLRLARQAGALTITEDRRSHDWLRIRVPLEMEAALFGLLERPSPTAEREAWAGLFARAATWALPVRYRDAWLGFCRTRSDRCRFGGAMAPFRRQHLRRAELHLALTARLLDWSTPCLLRTASTRLDVDSKFLERSLGTLQSLLTEASGGSLRTLADLGIAHNPTHVRFHGPIRVRLPGGITDYTVHRGESVLAAPDLATAEEIEFIAPRCVTVENLTTFHELCRLQCRDVFVHTSYPSQATIAFLNQLPLEIPLYHFGDTDPWGFDVLASLRQRLDRTVLPLHMHHRPDSNSGPLTPRAGRKLQTVLRNPLLLDVRDELQRMANSNSIGKFEQESWTINQTHFPYRT